MSDRAAIERRFARDDFARRMGALAANLRRIGSFAASGGEDSLLKSIIEESELFAEWVGLNASPDVGAELGALQRSLARWKLAWESADKRAVADAANAWSDRVLELSGLLQGKPTMTSVRIDIPRGHKYALVALPGVWANIDTVREGEFAFTRVLPLDLSTQWRDWLGSIQTRELSEAGFYLLVTRQSSRPGIYDQENQQLLDAAERGRMGLALAVRGMQHEQAFLLTGGHSERGLDVRHMAFLNARYKFGRATTQVTDAHAREATEFAQKIELLQQAGRGRLYRSLLCFMHALQLRDPVERLHQSVRCIEGFIQSERGEGKKQFKSRVQSLLKDRDQEILEELYELRGAYEHMRDPLDELEKYSSFEQRRRVLAERSAAGELIARFFLETIFKNPELLAKFRDDAGIAAFWQAPLSDRLKAWGEPLDLGRELGAMSLGLSRS